MARNLDPRTMIEVTRLMLQRTGIDSAAWIALANQLTYWESKLRCGDGLAHPGIFAVNGTLAK